MNGYQITRDQLSTVKTYSFWQGNLLFRTRHKISSFYLLIISLPQCPDKNFLSNQASYWEISETIILTEDYCRRGPHDKLKATFFENAQPAVKPTFSNDCPPSQPLLDVTIHSQIAKVRADFCKRRSVGWTMQRTPLYQVPQFLRTSHGLICQDAVAIV